MSAAFKGRTLQMTWNAGAIMGIRERSIALAGAPIDITSDENLGWRTLLADISAQDEINISISGVTKDFGLKEDWFGGDRTGAVVITYPDGSTITGTFFLASYTDTGPYNNAATFEAELVSSGAVTWLSGS